MKSPLFVLILALFGPVPAWASFTLGRTSLVVGSPAGSNSVVLAASTPTSSWTASSNATWLHLSAANQGGTGSANVIFSYDANSGPTRVGTLTIAGLTLTITQAGSTYVRAAGPVTKLGSTNNNFNMPWGVDVDSAGNVYIADQLNNAIKEWIAASNTVITLVSNGLNQPSGVSVDRSGNVIITDGKNNAIKKWIATSHNVVTVVSNGLNNPYHTAVDGAGNIYIADFNNGDIKEWLAANSNLITLVSSTNLSGPTKVSLDAATNLYISDYFHNEVKELISTNSNLVSLFSPLSGQGPNAAVCDGGGNLFVADEGNYDIEEWSAASRTLSTLISSGLNTPQDLALDAAGDIFIADRNNNAVKELPYVFVDPTPKSEGADGGTDSLASVLPATANLLPPFAPTSDQSWLTISSVNSGVVTFAFTANASSTNRTGHLNLLGQSITVTQSGTSNCPLVYRGNSLAVPTQGTFAPDQVPPLVILGEFNPAGPVGGSGLELPAGIVQDVRFYGAGNKSNFTLYALSYVGVGNHPNEQVFQVVASQSFADSVASQGTNILQVTNFTVRCGDVLAFAGIGPYYPTFIAEDQPNYDATYGNADNTGSGYPLAYQASPPGPNQTFVVGVTGDTNANYDYIPNGFQNQGRYYAIGVDILECGLCTSNCLSIICPGNITTTTCSNSVPVSYVAEASDICTNGYTITYNPPSGSLFSLGTTPVTATASDALGNVASCTFDVTVQSANCYTNCLSLSCSNLTIPCGTAIPTNPPAYTDSCCSNVVVRMIGTSNTYNGCTETIYQTWQAVDYCYGITNTCTRQITTEPSVPTLLCSNLTIACGTPVPTDPPPYLDACCSNVAVSLVNSTTNSNGSMTVVTQTWQAVDLCCHTTNTCARTVTMPSNGALVYRGNSLTVPTQGTFAPDQVPPLVILGEFNPAGPVGGSGLELPSGTVQDVRFYGQDYDFILYALAFAGPGPNPDEQTFHVVASQPFLGSFTNAGPHTLPVSNFFVNCGNLLAFAGIGPFYPNFTAEDQPSFDATYGDSTNSNNGYPAAFQATPPGPNQTFTVGIAGDTGAAYDYIPNIFNNQGRYYAIGVDISECGICSSNCLSITCPGNIVTNICSNSIPVTYVAEASDICTNNFQVTYNPPQGSLFSLGTTPVTATASDSLGNFATCTFNVIVLEATNPIVTPLTNVVVVPACATGCGPMPDATGDLGLPTPPYNITQSPSPGSVVCTNSVTDVTFTVSNFCGLVTNITLPVAFQTVCHSICINFTNPPDLLVTTCGTNPVPVFFDSICAYSGCCGEVTYCYNPPSGSLFYPDGPPQTVNITLSDACGESNYYSFHVIVAQSTNPPVISVPARIAVCTGSAVTGRLVVDGGSWDLSAFGFCSEGDGSNYAANVADYLTRDGLTRGATNILIYSADYLPLMTGELGNQLYQVLTNHGYNVVEDTGVQFVNGLPQEIGFAYSLKHYLENSNFDAVFLAGGELYTNGVDHDYCTDFLISGCGHYPNQPPEFQTSQIPALLNYITNGGGVFVAIEGGNQCANGSDDAGYPQWSQIMNPFGLAMSNPQTIGIDNPHPCGVNGQVECSTNIIGGGTNLFVTGGSLTLVPSPVLEGITNLFYRGANEISLTGASPIAQLVAFTGSHALIGVTGCIAPTNTGCAVMTNLAAAIQAEVGDLFTVSQSIPAGTTICEDTNLIITISSACGPVTNYTVTVNLVNCGISSNGCQVFNSGVTGPGANIPLAPGAADPNFLLVSEPAGAGTTSVVSSPLGPNWLPDTADSQWISPEEDSSDSPEGTYHYQLQFYVGCTNSQIVGRMAVESLSMLYLNGQFVGTVNGSSAWTPINLTSGLVLGNNVLEITVTNQNFWTGIRAELTNCCPASNCVPTFGCPSSPPNLVLNGGFETYSACPTGISTPGTPPAQQQISLATGWFPPTLASPDYFNACGGPSSIVGTPANFAGYAVPHGGQAYAGAYMYLAYNPAIPYDDPKEWPNATPAYSYREYIETQLASPLVAGQTYLVSFYVLLAMNESGYAMDNVGAYLSTGPLEDYSGTYGAFAITPQVRNPAGNFLSSTNNWMLVSGAYTAIGGEDYIAIGNFYDNAHTPAVQVFGTPSEEVFEAYYYVDDVSLSQFCGCPPNKSVDSCSPWNFDTPTAYNSCTGSNLSVVILNTVTNSVSPETITRTWSATVGNNSSTCSQTVTVLQPTPFYISYYPTHIPICTNGSGCGPMPNATRDISVSTATGGTNLTTTQSIPPGMLLCDNTMVTFTITDNCGDVTNLTVACTLNGEPIIDCPADIVVCAGSGTNNCGLMPDETLNPALTAGNIGPVTVTQSIPAGSQICSNTTVTLSVINACGTNSCIVPVVMPTPPTLSCPSNIVVSTACSSAQVFYDPTATSTYCSNVTVVCYPPSGTFFPPGTTTVAAVATDCCGNQSTCTFAVSVNQTAPCVAGALWAQQNAPNVIYGSVASSSDGSKLVVGSEFGLYTSTNYAVSWVPNLGSGYAAVASSADGTELAAGFSGGQIYVSADSGMTWTARATNQNWSSVTFSSDGTRLAATVRNGPIYTSADSGVTWTAQNSSSLPWQQIVSSSDGSKLAAIESTAPASTPGYIHTSTDYGVTWTTRGTNRLWHSIASSADGSKLVAVVYGGPIYTSADSGVTWTAQNSGNNYWYCVASSADGNSLVAGIYGGPIYTSGNAGFTWNGPFGPSYMEWLSMASSADGTKLVAVGYNQENNDFGYIFTSDCAPPCCVPPPTNMVLWLPFDETNGPISANLASPANYGTQINNPTPLIGSHVANSLVFNGADYVSVPDYPGIEIGTNDLTIDLWLDLAGTTPSNYVILDKGLDSPTSTGYSLQLSTNLLFFFMPSGYAQDSTFISGGQWHFIALSLSHNASKGSFFYVDGAVTESFAGGPPDLSNTNSLWIGASHPGSPFSGGSPWIGALDELEIYNRALSTNELNAIYNAGTAGKCKPCCYLNTISISEMAPGLFQINWGGCGILEQSTDLSGPWTPIQNAALSFVTPATGAQGFYRLVCPFVP